MGTLKNIFVQLLKFNNTRQTRRKQKKVRSMSGWPRNQFNGHLIFIFHVYDTSIVLVDTRQNLHSICQIQNS